MRTIATIAAMLLSAAVNAQDFLDLLCASTEAPAFLTEDERGFNDICALRNGENGLQAVRNQFARMIRANRQAGNQNQFYFPYSDVVVRLRRPWMEGTDWEVTRHPYVGGSCHNAPLFWDVGHYHDPSGASWRRARRPHPPSHHLSQDGSVPYARWWVHSRSEGKAWLVELCGDLPGGAATAGGRFRGADGVLRHGGRNYIVAFYESPSGTPHASRDHTEYCGSGERGCWTVVECEDLGDDCDSGQWTMTTGEFVHLVVRITTNDEYLREHAFDSVGVDFGGVEGRATPLGVKRRIEYFLDWVDEQRP